MKKAAIALAAALCAGGCLTAGGPDHAVGRHGWTLEQYELLVDGLLRHVPPGARAGHVREILESGSTNAVTEAGGPHR